MSTKNEKTVSVESIETKVQEDLYEEGSIDPIYQAKAHVLNRAIQEIGMGRYQVCFKEWIDVSVKLIPRIVVAPVHDCGLWLVCVRSTIFGLCPSKH